MRGNGGDRLPPVSGARQSPKLGAACRERSRVVQTIFPPSFDSMRGRAGRAGGDLPANLQTKTVHRAPPPLGCRGPRGSRAGEDWTVRAAGHLPASPGWPAWRKIRAPPSTLFSLFRPVFSFFFFPQIHGTVVMDRGRDPGWVRGGRKRQRLFRSPPASISPLDMKPRGKGEGGGADVATGQCTSPKFTE